MYLILSTIYRKLYNCFLPNTIKGKGGDRITKDMIDKIKEIRKFKSEGKERIAYGDIDNEPYKLIMTRAYATPYAVFLKKRGDIASITSKNCSSIKQANKIFEKLKKKHKLTERKTLVLPNIWNNVYDYR